ncbi:MAG: hypothetical protein IMY82_07635 [Chloroflexi bacterium]|nr:hypothetical protein [Chloroflexota bacterium]
MKKLLYRVSLILLLSTVLFAGACWLYADQILDKFARPKIEKLATQLFAAKVQIRQLAWTETGLEILDLSINSPGQVLVAIPRVELNFTPGSLWHRQLDALHIAKPQVEIFPSQNRGKAQKTALNIPEQLPFTIEMLTVSNGQLLLHTADRQLQLHGLNFSGALQQNIDFILSAFFGPDARHPVDITGTVKLSRQQTLTLASISWQNQQLLTAPLLIKLAGTDFTLGSSMLRLDQFDHSKLQEILTALGQPSPLPEEIVFSLADATIGFALEGQAIKFELQVAAGLLGWNDLTGTFSQLKLLINREQKGWKVAGQLRGPAKSTLNFTTWLDEKNQLAGQALLEIPDPDRLKTELLGGPPLKIAGGLKLAAEYSLEENRFQLTIDIHGHLPEPPGKDYLINIGHLNGRGKLLLAENKEEFSLNLQLASHPFFSAAGDFRQLNFSLAPSDLQDFKKLLSSGLLPEQLQTASGLKAAGQLSRKAAHWTGNIQLTAEEITLPDLALNEIVCRGKLHLASDQINFEETSFRFDIARGDELSAQVNARGAGEFSAQKFSLVLKQLSLAHLNYMSPDGQTGVGEAALELRGDISGLWPEGPIALELNGTVAAQEILAGEFYADLSAYKGDFLLTGEFAPDTGELHAGSFKINLPQLGALAATGLFSPERISVQGHVELADLAESYGEHIGPLLSGFQPAAAELALEGGMSLDYNLLWNLGGWQTNGTLQLRGLNAYRDRPRLKIVDGTGSIPFAISFGKAPATENPTAEYPGEISFGALSAGLASLEEGRLELAASTNRLTFRSPLLLRLAGGRVAIENLILGWPSGKPQGSVKINIAEVDLETLTEELGLPVMQGRFSGDLGTIRYADRQLSTDGLAGIEVFGGRFQLSNMRYTDPFSSYPTFHADIDFSGLDLLQATRTFDFGEMNGVFDGHIHGFKLFGSTPAAFEAAVSTRKKGKRNISVKALNNLSILSQGGISSALSRGIYRFIDFYRYQKIGFKCSLENDIFTLLGTALPGSDRYLVHGGLLPPRIDITTTTPTISFKEMMNRLGRIERAGN